MGVTHLHEEAPRRLWRSLAHGEASRRTASRRKRGPEANEGPQKKPEETPKSNLEAAKAAQEAPKRSKKEPKRPRKRSQVHVRRRRGGVCNM